MASRPSCKVLLTSRTMGKAVRPLCRRLEARATSCGSEHGLASLMMRKN